jgi:hypothetical protein
MKDFQCNWVSKDFVPEFSDSATGESDILDKLFGDPAELADDELDNLFTALAPGVDPAATIRAKADAAAVKYRLQNKMPPDHIQAALDATRRQGIRLGTARRISPNATT